MAARAMLAHSCLFLQVERTTNHDVKAIEYVLKERFKGNPELAKARRVPPCAGRGRC